MKTKSYLKKKRKNNNALKGSITLMVPLKLKLLYYLEYNFKNVEKRTTLICILYFTFNFYQNKTKIIYFYTITYFGIGKRY